MHVPFFFGGVAGWEVLCFVVAEAKVNHDTQFYRIKGEVE